MDISKLETPLTDKIMNAISSLLVVFKIVVEKLNLVKLLYDNIPQLENFVSPPVLTMVLTVIIGLFIIWTVFMILIRLCKFTLNFFVFAQWAVVGALVVGLVYNVFK